MKKLQLPLFMLLISVASAQKIIRTEKVSDHSTHVIGNNFEGVIFSGKYAASHYTDDTNIKQFNPSLNDILQAEMLIKEEILTKNDHIIKDYFIRKNIRKYLRQYVGYSIQNGQKILFINLFWKGEIQAQERLHRELPEQPAVTWTTHWHWVNDGGHFFWRIKVNLSTLKLFNFSENGLA